MPPETQAELPASLQRLTADWRWDPQASLHLGHLTALTELDLGVRHVVHDGDVLPPNLVCLRRCFSGVEALKGLSSLRHLDGLHRTDSLVELGNAGLGAQLTHVGLWGQLCEQEEVVEGEGGDVHNADASFGLADQVKRLQEAGVAAAVRLVVLVDIDGAPGSHLGPAVFAELRRLPNLQALHLGY